MASDIEAQNRDLTDISQLLEIIRGGCHKRLTSSTSSKLEISTLEIDNRDDFLYGRWIALILLSGPALQITLKIHFYNKAIASLVAISMRKPPRDITDSLIMDFMRELCNLSAGEIKSNLLNCDVAVGISLPLITHGFDEVLFSDVYRSSQRRDWWALSWGDGRLICSTEIEVLRPAELAKIKAQSPQDEMDDDDNDIDFL